MTLFLSLSQGEVSYEIPDSCDTLLSAFFYIREHYNPTFAFGANCRSRICGSCAVTVNDKPALACAVMVSDGMKVSPLKHVTCIQDLWVNDNALFSPLRQLKSSLQPKTSIISEEESHRFRLQEECILCGSCSSICPVLETNPSFLAPFALTKLWRYRSDVRHASSQSELETIQMNGIWDCVLCGECALVCPKGINSKNDIIFLRTQSSACGYQDPQATMSFGFGGFSTFNDLGDFS